MVEEKSARPLSALCAWVQFPQVYHPEFVCDGGFIDPIRRSPFPTLLIKHCGLKDELFEPSGMYRFDWRIDGLMD